MKMKRLWGRRDYHLISLSLLLLKLTFLHFAPVAVAQDQHNNYFICEYASQANDAALQSNEASVWMVVASKVEEMKRIEAELEKKSDDLRTDTFKALKDSEDSFKQARKRFEEVKGKDVNDRKLNQLIRRHAELSRKAMNAAQSTANSLRSIRDEVIARARITRHAKDAAIQAAVSFGALAKSAQGLAQTRTREGISDVHRMDDAELNALSVLVDTVIGSVAGGEMWTAPGTTCARGSLCAAYLTALDGPNINERQVRDFQPADVHAMATFLRIALLGESTWNQLRSNVLSLTTEQVGDEEILQHHRRWAKDFGDRLGETRVDAVLVSDLIRGVVSKVSEDSEISKVWWPVAVAIIAHFVSEHSRFQTSAKELINKSKQEFVSQEKRNHEDWNELMARLKAELVNGWHDAGVARDSLLDALSRGKRGEWASIAIRINDVANNGGAGMLGLTTRTLVTARLPCADDLICHGISSASKTVVDAAPFVAAALNASTQQIIAQSVAFDLWIKEEREGVVGRQFSAHARYFDILAHLLERRVEWVNESANALWIPVYRLNQEFKRANDVIKERRILAAEYFTALTTLEKAEKETEEAKKLAESWPWMAVAGLRERVQNPARLQLFEGELRRMGGTACHVGNEIRRLTDCGINGDNLCAQAFR